MVKREGINVVVSPAGGYCVLLNVEKYMDVALYKNPVTTFTAHLYAKTGIRGGIHLSGMMKEYCKIFYVRFALPLCISDKTVDGIIVAFVDVLINLPVLPDMEKTSSLPGLAGMLNARYEPISVCTESEDIKTEVLV